MRRTISFVARIVSGAFDAILGGRSRTTALDRVWRLDAVDQPERLRLGGVQEPAGEEHVLHARPGPADREPAVARARQTVAERARDRNAEGRFRRARRADRT